MDWAGLFSPERWNSLLISIAMMTVVVVVGVAIYWKLLRVAKIK